MKDQDYIYYINPKGNLIGQLEEYDKYEVTGVDNRNVYSDDLKYIILI